MLVLILSESSYALECYRVGPARLHRICRSLKAYTTGDMAAWREVNKEVEALQQVSSALLAVISYCFVSIMSMWFICTPGNS